MIILFPFKKACNLRDGVVRRDLAGLHAGKKTLTFGNLRIICAERVHFLDHGTDPVRGNAERGIILLFG